MVFKLRYPVSIFQRFRYSSEFFEKSDALFNREFVRNSDIFIVPLILFGIWIIFWMENGYNNEFLTSFSNDIKNVDVSPNFFLFREVLRWFFIGFRCNYKYLFNLWRVEIVGLLKKLSIHKQCSEMISIAFSLWSWIPLVLHNSLLIRLCQWHRVILMSPIISSEKMNIPKMFRFRFDSSYPGVFLLP